MIVCLCRGVRCSEVRRAVRAGARSVEAVGEACGAGTDCGGCRGVIDDILDEATDERAVSVGHGARVRLSMVPA